MPLNMVPANKGIQGYADSMDVLTFLDSEWVRVEIQFGNKDREIPHEIVLKTDHYFVGAHKALEPFIDVAALRCRTDQTERETTLETLSVRSARNSAR